MKLHTALTFFFLIGLSYTTAANDFHIKEVELTYTITETGSVEVIEKRTYEFDGDFSWADYRLENEVYDNGDIRNVTISEDGEQYQLVDEKEGPAGSYYYETDEDPLYVIWHYSASDERRTFEISYTIDNILEGNNKWVQFFWKAVTDRWDKSTGQVDITVNFPNDEEHHSWVRSQNRELFTTSENGRFHITGGPVEENQFVAVRVVLPAAQLDTEPIENQEVSPQWAEDKETKWLADYEQYLERQEQLADYAEIAAYAIILISFGVILFGWKNRQIKGRAAGVSPTSDQPDVPPAIAAWAMNHHIISEYCLPATLFDLSRKGAFKIEEFEGEDGSETYRVTSTGHTPDNLTDWELALFHHIQQKAGDDGVKLNNLFGDSSADQKMLEKWYVDLKKDANEHLPVQPESKIKYYWTLGIGLLLFVLSFGILSYHPVLAFTAMFLSLMMALSSTFLRHYTPQGLQRYNHIYAYYLWLQNPDQTGTPEERAADLCYAIAFGLPKKKVEQLTENIQMPGFLKAYSADVALIAASVSSTTTTTTTVSVGTSGGSGGAG